MLLHIESACVLVFKATFNNILAISWLSVLLLEETRVQGETLVTDKTLSHNVVSSSPCLSRIRTQNISNDRH